MQKKRILQIKSLPRVRDFEMCARAAVKNVNGERVLVVWIYDDTDSKTPEIIIACTKKEYALYDMGCGKWKSCSLENLTGHACNFYNAEMPEAENAKVKKFCNTKKYQANYRYWDDWVNEIRRDMRWQQERKRNEKRMERLHERCDSILDIPEGFDKWVQEEFQIEHTLTYKKKGRRATVTCSHCGKTVEYIFEKYTYEDEFAKYGEKPYHNEQGTCLECGAKGTFKAAGKYKGVYGRTKHAYMVQNTKVPGRDVIRYFHICMDQADSWEKVTPIEIARCYLEEGKRETQIDYHKSSYYSEDFWDDCNLNGMSNIKIEDGALYPERLAMLQETKFKYSAIDLYINKYPHSADIIGYLKAYNEFPGMEFLAKMGLWELVFILAKGTSMEYYIDKHARKAWDVLMIDKSKLKKLQQREGDRQLLKIMQFEKAHNLHLSDDIENWFTYIYHRPYNLDLIMQFMSLEKFMNYVERENPLDETEDIRIFADEYVDYLSMRDELGYDMTKSTILFPRNMHEEHDKLVEMRTKHEQDLTKKKKEKQFPAIKQNYKRLLKKFKSKRDGYIIRPCNSASEIVDEGRLQHHCVGGDTYLSKHNEGKSFILVLRKVNEPQTPFVTVEISPNFEVLQWYGPHDKKNNESIGLDQKTIDKWLKKYTSQKGKKLKTVGKAAGTDAEQQLLAPAI